MAISSHSVEILRKKVLGDKDLSKIWEYFLDRFANEPAFRSASEPCPSAEIESLMELVGRRIWGKPHASVSGGTWLEVPEYSLIHGSCIVEGFPASALYFPELATGVAGFHTSSSTRMIWARFSSADLAKIPTTAGIQ